MRPLFTISQDLLAIDQAFEACDGDLSKADPQLVQWFDAMGDEVGRKVDDVIDYTRQMRGEADAALKESAFWQQQANRRTAKAVRLERSLLEFLQRHGYSRLTTDRGRSISVRGNGGVAPVRLADMIDPATLPAEFVRVKREVDLNEVRKALEAGAVLPFARLDTRGVHLSIA